MDLIFQRNKPIEFEITRAETELEMQYYISNGCRMTVITKCMC